MNVEDEVLKISCNSPYLVFQGQPGTENAQFYVAAENMICIESKSVQDAMIDLIATYYTYDMEYPKPIAAQMMFLQRYVFDLQDNEPVPLSASKLWSNLQKL